MGANYNLQSWAGHAVQKRHAVGGWKKPFMLHSAAAIASCSCSVAAAVGPRRSGDIDKAEAATI